MDGIYVRHDRRRASLERAASDGMEMCVDRRRVYAPRTMGALRWIVLTAGLATFAPYASAHHSASAQFDVAKRISVQGTLTKIDWINPHIFVFFEREEGGATQMWEAEGAPPAWWRNVGINRSSFAAHIGESVVIEGMPSRGGSPTMALTKITFASGEVLQSISAK